MRIAPSIFYKTKLRDLVGKHPMFCKTNLTRLRKRSFLFLGRFSALLQNEAKDLATPAFVSGRILAA